MSVGFWNPLPMQIGGEDPPVRRIYLALRGAVGGGTDEGNGAGPLVEDGGIEDAWRYAKAVGIWMGESVQEAASAEFFFDRLTHNIPLWERTLGVPRQDVVELERQDIAAIATAQQTAIFPRLRDALRARFHPGITLSVIDRSKQAVVMRHKSLGDRSGTVAYGEHPQSAAPAYATGYRLRVVWPVVPLSQEQILSISRVLRAVLPAWWDFCVLNQEASGFICGGGADGGSLLGQRAVS